MNSLPRLVGLWLCVVVGCMPLLRTREVCEGQVAPPTEGTAADGQSLRLSDYRGRVVLLCFWHGG
jgi:hypothetical protein